MTTSFSTEQYDLAYPDGIEHHWWNRYRTGVIARLCRQAMPDGVAMLEVGCGKGVEVQELRKTGLKVRGVELAPVVPLCSVADCVTSDQDATTLPLAQRTGVKCILLLDVIEHVSDPTAFLRALSASFPDLANVIVTVPARQELWSNYDEFYGHYRRYTLPMLSALADELDWEAQRSGYFFQLLYVPMRLLGLLGVKRGTEISAPSAAARVFHAFVAACHRLEEWLVPAAIPGTSAYVVYRCKP